MSERQEKQDVDTGHDYDGIREFDNPLPRWWLLTFYGTVVFSVFYWLHYHTLETGLLPSDAYKAEIKQAEDEENARQAKLEAEGKGVNEQQLVAMAKDAQAISRGAALFKQNCLACHGDKGQGVVGPNLTDDYWLHGGKAMDIYKTISVGIPEKGMPAWRPLLGATKVQDATAFILTLRGKKAPGKAPQGITEQGEKAPASP
jgi:cytochrome c oxidase cbb3-type subunit 3